MKPSIIDQKEVYCIQDYFGYGVILKPENEICKFYKNNTYKIKITTLVTSGLPYKINHIIVIDHNNNLLVFDELSHFGVNTFQRYFSTIKQQRKLKLEKIYENR